MMPYDDDPYDDLASRGKLGTGLLLALILLVSAGVGALIVIGAFTVGQTVREWLL